MPKLLFSVDPTETFSGIQIQIFHILDKGMLGITILLEIILIAEVNSCTGKLKFCFKIMFQCLLFKRMLNTSPIVK